MRNKNIMGVIAGLLLIVLITSVTKSNNTGVVSIEDVTGVVLQKEITQEEEYITTMEYENTKLQHNSKELYEIVEVGDNVHLQVQQLKNGEYRLVYPH